MNFPFSKLKFTLHLYISNSASLFHWKVSISFLQKTKTNTVSENILLPLGPGNKPLPFSDSLSFPLSYHMPKLQISAQHSAVWVFPFFPPFSSSWSSWSLVTPLLPPSSLYFKPSSRLIFKLRSSFSSYISTSLQPDPQCQPLSCHKSPLDNTKRKMSIKMRQSLSLNSLCLLQGKPWSKVPIFSFFLTSLPTPPSWHHSCGILIPINSQPLEVSSSYFSWPLHTSSYGDIIPAPHSKTQASLSVSWVWMQCQGWETKNRQRQSWSWQPSTGCCTLRRKRRCLLCLFEIQRRPDTTAFWGAQLCSHTAPGSGTRYSPRHREESRAGGTWEHRAGEVSEQKEQTSTEKNLTAETSHTL